VNGDVVVALTATSSVDGIVVRQVSTLARPVPALLRDVGGVVVADVGDYSTIPFPGRRRDVGDQIDCPGGAEYVPPELPGAAVPRRLRRHLPPVRADRNDRCAPATPR
jgi:hypothetical protein